MNDEIKEKMTIGKAKKILRGFLAKDCYYDTPLYYAIPYLLDYITNLQHTKEYLGEVLYEKDKELEKLNKENEKWWAIIKDYEMDSHDLWNKNNELEQENEKLKKIIKENTILVKDENGNYQECNINPLDYKSRIEKVVEYIKNCP